MAEIQPAEVARVDEATTHVECSRAINDVSRFDILDTSLISVVLIESQFDRCAWRFVTHQKVGRQELGAVALEYGHLLLAHRSGLGQVASRLIQ